MRSTIDAAGRIVIPKHIRIQAGLRPGMPLDVRWIDGLIEIEPAHTPMTLLRKGRFVVALPQVEGPPLTAAAVEHTRDALAREHEQGP
jgi:AbrB family looped-hinge helix DNA binding protein